MSFISYNSDQTLLMALQLKGVKNTKVHKSLQSRGVSEHTLADFWDKDEVRRLAGDRTSGNLVKLVKLAAYRDAVVNYVKVVAPKDVTIAFYGAESFTNGQGITISSDVSEKNFDVVVGLALHEASHCLLTDFQLLQQVNRLINGFHVKEATQ